MKIVIAMDSFKGTISACQASEIIAAAITELVPDAQVLIKPMADGGEGTAEAMLKSVSGQWIPRTVTGPLPDMSAEAGFAWWHGLPARENTAKPVPSKVEGMAVPLEKTALVEMACASGLGLISKDQYNPMKTTTYGTGQLIKAALEYNPCKPACPKPVRRKPLEGGASPAGRILLAVGGSATVDAGIGAATALGWKFLGSKGIQVPPGGEGLEQIVKIVEPPEAIAVAVEVLCDVQNPLCGDHGAAKIYGPQKGATPEMVNKLEAGLANLAELVHRQLNCDIKTIPGGGASGGLAAGAVAFMNAKLLSGIEAIIKYTNLEAELADADWIITGEGCFDRQSLYGKVVSGIAKIAAKSNTALAVIAGQVNLSKQEYQKLGIATAMSCKPEGESLESALKSCRALLRLAAERFVRENLI